MEIRKHPQSDLERKKTKLFQIGMIIALVAVMSAFEYKSYDKTTIVLPAGAFYEIDEYRTPVTIHKKKQLPPQPITIITSVDDIDDDDGDIEFDVTANADTPMPVYEPKIEDDDDVVPDDIPLLVSEIKPEFPGGLPALYTYLRQNVNYPTYAKEIGIQGTVYLSFVVEKDGSISNVEILRTVGGGCDEEAIRVVKSMPHWSPGKQMGRPVRVIFNLPIKFALQ